VNAIEIVARGQTRPVYLLEAVLDTLPKISGSRAWRRRAHSSGFGGTSYSPTALSDFMANLKATGKFKDVDIVDAKQDLTKRRG